MRLSSPPPQHRRAFAFHYVGGQRFRFLFGSVGNAQQGGLFSQQRAQHTAHRPTRAQDKHPFLVDAPALIITDILHQPGTIGVITVQLFAIPPQGVHRTGLVGPLGDGIA